MAGYPTASGVQSMSGIYIPEIWSLKTLVKFYLTTVFGEIANTDYEGEIKKFGDTVNIRTIPDITIRKYQIGQGLIRTRETPGLSQLKVDKGNYYSMPFNTVELKQADIPYMEKWTDDAGQNMTIAIDYEILSNVYADVAAANAGATAGAKTGSYNMGASGVPVGLDKTNILDFIVDMASVLDEQNIPNTERWLLLPPVLLGMLKKGDIKDSSMTGDAVSPIRNGRIGMIDRFTTYNSNNVYSAADGTTGDLCFNIMAGHKAALTFASQLTDNRTIDNPNDFGKIIEGLQVFGYKMIQEKAAVHGYVFKQ
jgi:hypothetical protein